MFDCIGMESSQGSALADDVAFFRKFNRMYTRVIGVLEEGLLHSDYTLAEARVLYELANNARPRAKEIAETLGMDAGYLSRLLAKLEGAGLLKRKPSKQDSRSADLSLTAKGRTAAEQLGILSDREARTLLEGLSPDDRVQLIHSMSVIEGVLKKDEERAPSYVLRPHRPGDMGWVVSRQAAAYVEEYGWDDTFEALVARIVADFLTNFDPKRERCWIAEAKGQSVGHIFLVQHPEQPDVAKLRLLLVESSARGMGLGGALVNECLRFARAAGYRKVTLWTQSILEAAHHIYKKAGFRLVHEEPHRSFGKDLIGQTWELDFDEDRP